MYWLEGGENLLYLFSMPNFRPAELTITVRYSDWWYWESNEPLRMDEDWLRFFRGNPGLRVLKVEYETLNWKRAEMMRIVERNKSWKLPVRREEGTFEGNELEGYLSAEGTVLKEWKWKGTSKLGGQRWAHHGVDEKVEYVVVMDTWRFVDGELSDEEMEGRSRDYLGSEDDEDEYDEYDEDNEENEDEDDEDDEDNEEDEDEDDEDDEDGEEENIDSNLASSSISMSTIR
jgi:hypothetical protein